MLPKRLAIATFLAPLTVAGLAYHSVSMRTEPMSYGGRSPGLFEVDTFHVPPGETLYLKDDLRIRSENRVLIEGDIVALPREGTGTLPGVSVSITSSGPILILGDILAGIGSRAFDGPTTLENCRQVGGAGGDIHLSAPAVLVNGRLVAGEGGASGPKAEAPAGGNVRVEGYQYTTRNEARLEGESPWEHGRRLSEPGGFGLFGGRGGSHLAPLGFDSTYPAGAGGRGGDVVCQRLPVQEALPHTNQEWLMIGAFLEEYGLGRPGSDPGNRPSSLIDEECPDGPPKAGPAPGFGGTGTTGTSGDNGTEMSPQGETGGPGGPGGNAAGDNGDPGNDGNDCCDPLIDPGGKGGKGAKGQDMTGGKGGTGGVGGNGWWDASIPDWGGPGGDGGPGGPGGNGTGGTGGQGGDGGKPGGAAGAGGGAGVGIKGPPGDGGTGGRGTQQGNPGGEGTEGNKADGNEGGSGNVGGQCS